MPTDTEPEETVGPEPEVVEPVEPPPENVIQAIARVERDIGGIEKLNRTQRKQRGLIVDDSDKGVSWGYRSIDQIAAAAQPLLGANGVVIVPTVKSHVVDEITINNNPWTDTTVTVRWKIYGPGGVDDKIASTTIGLGRDNSDKGYNKAMTNAYKNLLLRLLSIGDPRDDQEHTAFDQPDREPSPEDPIRKLWTDLVGAVGDNEDRKDAVKQIGAEFDTRVTESAIARHASLRGAIERQLAEWAGPETEGDNEPEPDPEPDSSGETESPEEPEPSPEEPSDDPPAPGDVIDDTQLVTLSALIREFAAARRQQVHREFEAAHGHKIENLPSDLYDDALTWLSEKVEAEPSTPDEAEPFDPEPDESRTACVDCGEIGHEAVDCPNS